MFLQTVINVVNSASELYWRLQPTAAGRSIRFSQMHGLWVHSTSTCCLTMPARARKLSANDSEEAVFTYLFKFELSAGIISGKRCTKLFESFFRRWKQFLNCTYEDMWKFSAEQAVRSSRKRLRDYVKVEDSFREFAVTYVFIFMVFALFWMLLMWDNDNVEIAKLPWFVIILYIYLKISQIL